MVSDQLSKALRKRFRRLTVERLDAMWAWVVAMPRGVVDPRTLELDAFSAEDLLVCLHLARELDYRNREESAKLIRGLSAKRKRYLYPRSHDDDQASVESAPVQTVRVCDPASEAVPIAAQEMPQVERQRTQCPVGQGESEGHSGQDNQSGGADTGQ
jgi:hypothetical protein